MAGIYIKGMEMPKGSHEIIIRIQSDGQVLDQHGHRLNLEPFAIPVPKHGDLIDRRVAYDKIAEQEGGNYVDMDAVDMGLNETPTVIPASEEGE